MIVTRNLAAAALAVLAAASPAPARQPGQEPAKPPATLTLDVSVVDAESRPALDVGPDELLVTVGGARRPVRSVQYLWRGPVPTRPAAASLEGAEPAFRIDRPSLVALVVDEATIGPDTEQQVRAQLGELSARLFDQLGPGARVGLFRLHRHDAGAGLTTDRALLDADIGRLRGRADEPGLLLPPRVTPDLCALLAQSASQPPQASGENVQEGLDAMAVLDAVRVALDDHGRATLDAVTDLAGRLRAEPGSKVVVLVGSSLAIDPVGSRLDRLSRALAAARVQLAALVVEEPKWMKDHDAATWRDRSIRGGFESLALWAGVPPLVTGPGGLSAVADLGGGVAARAAQAPGEAVDLLCRHLAGFHAVVVEARPSDFGRGALDVSVRALRPGLRCRTRSRWTARDDGADLRAARATPAPERTRRPEPAAPLAVTSRSADLEPRFDLWTAGVEAPAGDTAASGRCRASAGDWVLEDLLACATDYATAFERTFSSMVAEERLEQLARPAPGALVEGTAARVTRADMLLVEDPAGGWMPFRDVFEVDGRPVGGRGDRLRTLFLEQPRSAVAQARQIAEESARYNIGGVTRTLNVPTLPLLFLDRSEQPRFAFRLAGDEHVSGLRAVKVAFAERGRPTFITGATGGNRPASGLFWIDPRNGAVLATRLQVLDQKVTLSAVVTYAPAPAPDSGLWIPAEMREHYRRDTGATISTLASYSNLRRFQVVTGTAIK